MISNFENRINFLKTNDSSILNLFRPLYIILSLMGLFPYTIKYPTSDDPRVEATAIILNVSCASVMILTLSTFFSLNIIYFLKIIEKNITMMQISYIVEVLLLISIGIVTYICIYKNRKAFINILAGISVTWNDLGIREVEDIYKFFKFHVKFIVIGWLSMLVIPLVIEFVMLGSTQMIYKQKLYGIVPDIVAVSVVGFYYVLILLVACMLKKIDQYVKSLNNDRENEILNTLSCIELAYVKTIEIEREICRIFEVPLAMMLMQGFQTTLRQAHELYHGLYHTKQFGGYGSMMAAFYIVYPLSKMFAMAYTGTMLKNLVTRIGRSLYEIPVKTDDTKLYFEIQHFSKLMDYYDTEIKIFGFCSLDSGLWFNAVASVLTYFVILVQFDL